VAAGGRFLPFGLSRTRLQDAGVGLVGLDFLAALGTSAKRRRTFVDGVRLSLQGLVEHLLGEHLTDRQDDIFDFRERRSPGWPLRTVQAIHQTLGNAFEIGANWIGGSSRNLR